MNEEIVRQQQPLLYIQSPLPLPTCSNRGKNRERECVCMRARYVQGHNGQRSWHLQAHHHHRRHPEEEEVSCALEIAVVCM